MGWWGKRKKEERRKKKAEWGFWQRAMSELVSYMCAQYIPVSRIPNRVIYVSFILIIEVSVELSEYTSVLVIEWCQ